MKISEVISVKIEIKLIFSYFRRNRKMSKNSVFSVGTEITSKNIFALLQK